MESSRSERHGAAEGYPSKGPIGKHWRRVPSAEENKQIKTKEKKDFFLDLVFLQRVSRMHQGEFPTIAQGKKKKKSKHCFFFFFFEADNPRAVVLSDESSDKRCSSALYALYLGNKQCGSWKTWEPRRKVKGRGWSVFCCLG